MFFGKRKKKNEMDNFMQQADRLAKAQFYREALELYKSEWEQNQDNLKALFGMTACLYRLGNYPSALRHIEVLMSKDSDYPKAAPLRDQIRQRLSVHKSKKCLLDQYDNGYEDDLNFQQPPEKKEDI